MAYSIEQFERHEAELDALLAKSDAKALRALSDNVADLRRRSPSEPLPALRPRPTIADYDADLALSGTHPAHDAFSHLRDLLLIGIRVGTISVDDLYCRVRPAVVALTVLLDPGAGPVAPELADRIRHDAGRKPRSWAAAVLAVDSWPGSLHRLLRGDPTGPLERQPLTAVLSGLSDHLWRGSNILLALAPPETLACIVADAAPMTVTGPIVGSPGAVRSARALVRLVSHAPLSRAVVDHALTSEASARLRLHLAANLLTPDATLHRLLAFADRELGIAIAICANECAPRDLRLAAYRKVRDSAVWDLARLRLPSEVGTAFDIERIAAASPEQEATVCAMIQRRQEDLSPEARLFVYAKLARIAGLEAVWNLELERVGSAEDMHPAVRASMESGTLTPLLEAALATPYRGLPEAPAGIGVLRREELLDRPFPWRGEQDSDVVKGP